MSRKRSYGPSHQRQWHQPCFRTCTYVPGTCDTSGTRHQEQYCIVFLGSIHHLSFCGVCSENIRTWLYMRSCTLLCVQFTWTFAVRVIKIRQKCFEAQPQLSLCWQDSQTTGLPNSQVNRQMHRSQPSHIHQHKYVKTKYTKTVAAGWIPRVSNSSH
jgi:hypothetical protein